jgi:predicted nucleic acid-binding Zn ribbon protein
MNDERSADPAPIRSAIERALENLGITEAVQEYAVLEAWPGIVGEQIARVTTAERITDGVLFVKVSNAPWRNELVFLKQDLIGKLNQAMGREFVHDIVFR